MACKACGNGGDYEPKRCECCYLVDGDERIKQTRYCTFCQAFICDACWNDGAKRTQAFLTSTIEKVRKWFGGQ